MLTADNFDFSFSGLKTALRYQLQKDKDWQKRVDEYAYEFQEAVVEVLIGKTIKAGKTYQAKTVMLSGGVAASLRLRQGLERAVQDTLPQVRFLKPQLSYTTDNAAMIAVAGVFYAQDNIFTPLAKLSANPNLSLTLSVE